MIEFSKDHSSAWMEMMSAYQVFRAKLFDWAHITRYVTMSNMELMGPI